jgi:dipeptidyl aminopeptidase/acylaminoacyl peptidase
MYFVRLAGAAVLAFTLFSPLFMLSVAQSAAWRWTHPVRRAATLTPGDYGLPYEELRLDTDDGLRLAAWYVPSHNGAAVIMLHGLGVNRGGDLDLARAMAERGYGVLLPDLRAHGESEGEVSTLGPREVRDVRAAVEHLQNRPEIDRERIGVWGASLGGAVAILAGAQLPDLKAVVAQSAFASVEWLVQNQFSNLERMPTWLAPVVVAMGGWQAGVDTREIAPVRQVGRISPRPLMIIHGERDSMFLVQNAALLAEAAGEPKELWILPGLGHTGLYAADPETYGDRVGAFFDRALLAASIGTEKPQASAVGQ